VEEIERNGSHFPKNSHRANTLATVTPILLKGLWLKKFQATFALRRITDYNSEAVDFVFGATDANNYRTVQLPHRNGTASADLPWGKGTKDGALLVVSGTQTAANKPALTATDVLWYRVTVDGSTVSVRCQVSATEPSDSIWSSVGACYSSSAFQSNGGRIGFSCDGSSCSVDDLEVRSFNTATSAYDTIEQVEPFTVGTEKGSLLISRILTLAALGPAPLFMAVFYQIWPPRQNKYA
jgi:hypothetical protein